MLIVTLFALMLTCIVGVWHRDIKTLLAGWSSNTYKREKNGGVPISTENTGSNIEKSFNINRVLIDYCQPIAITNNQTSVPSSYPESKPDTPKKASPRGLDFLKEFEDLNKNSD